MTQEILAQRLWTAAQKDSDLRTRLRSSYRGRVDVCDALWWRANPLSPTPAGRPDPAVDLIDLKAAVYRLHSDPEPLVEFVDPITQRTVYATETEHRLRTRMREQAQEDAALDAVLTAAESATGDASATDLPAQRAARLRDGGFTAGANTTPGATPDAEGAGAGAAAGGQEGTHGPGVRAEFGLVAGGPWRRRRFAALLVAAGAIAGALATFVGVTLAGPAELPTDADPAAKVSVDYSAPGAAEPRKPEPDALQIFTEPANFATGDAPNLGAEFIPASIRSVGSVPATAGYGVYVAQRGTAQYCIIVQNADHTGTSACAGPGTLARTGLRVNATVLGTVAVGGNPRMPVLLDLYVVWAPDGSITTTSHPYVDSCVTAPGDC